MRSLTLGLLAGSLFLSGCDLVPGPPVTVPDFPSKTLPVPAPPPPAPRPPSPAPPSASLTGLGNPFADVYPASFVNSKGRIEDLAVVDGRIYLGHGSTASHTPVRPIYYDVAAGRWGSDDARIAQEATLGLQVGPSGRLYATSDDAQGRNAVLMIRRERDGSWTQRAVDDRENHSRDTYEWVDPQTGETLVFVQNAAPHFPDVSVSYDGGESFVRYGYERAPGNVRSLDWYKFFEFKGDLYAASLPTLHIPGRPAPDPKPYLVRYTRDREHPFEVVTYSRGDVFPGDGTEIKATMEINGRIVMASSEFYAGDALDRDRIMQLDVPDRAMDIIRVGGEVYLLSLDRRTGTSALYSTRDGRTVTEFASFDRPFVAVEHTGGAFYLAESGGSVENSLWRYVPGE